jgi:hypothetical protein
MNARYIIIVSNSRLFNEFMCTLGFFGMSGSFHSRFKGLRVPKKAQFTHERVKYTTFFCSTSPLRLQIA